MSILGRDICGGEWATRLLRSMLLHGVIVLQPVARVGRTSGL